MSVRTARWSSFALLRALDAQGGRQMDDSSGPTLKTFSFGGCDFSKTSPRRDALSPQTAVLNVTLSFEDALRLNLAIDECVRKLNSYKRSTVEGRRTALNLAIHLDKNRVTVNEGKL